MSKSDLTANYPIKYLKPFNYRLKEVIVTTKKCKVINLIQIIIKCEIKKDGDKESKPTCEWYMEGGKKVPDSQGFCCECTSDQKWDDTFGSSKDTT